MKKNIMYDLAHKETDVFKQMIEKPKYTCFEGGLQTTGRLSILTPWNPPPWLKFVFCAFKLTRDLVRSYVTLAIAVKHTDIFREHSICRPVSYFWKNKTIPQFSSVRFN
jgi:hypothetical protein